MIINFLIIIQGKMINKIKKMPLFWKIYSILVMVILIGFIVVWGLLWSSLVKYEHSRPEYAMDKLLTDFNKDNTDNLKQYVATSDETSDSQETIDNAVSEYLHGMVDDAEWSYRKKQGEYTDERPAYQLKKNGEKTDVVVYLKQTSGGKVKWEVEDVQGLECLGKDYVITVPSGAELYIDGKQMAPESISETKEAEVLSNVSKFIKTPMTDVYELKGVYTNPEITAKGSLYGGELNIVSNDDGKISFGFEANQELISSQEERIKNISQIYGKYIVNNIKFKELEPYILYGSYAYSYLSKISYTNIWLDVSKAPTFNDMKVFNYQSYTTDCFSCEVTFDEVVNYDNDTTKTYPTHIEYIFIKRSGKWNVADLILLK